MDFSTIITTVAGILVGGGGLWGVWNFFKSKVPDKAQDLIEEVIKRISDSSSSASTTPDRLATLEHAEAVVRFFEAVGSKPGIEAMQVVVREIVAPTKA